MLPLQGVKVLDLSSVVFGPLASQTLADYGAEVIKVEAPGGDSTRHTGPATEPGMAALFLGSNRSKKSVVLDLKQTGARDALMSMLGDADVFMHSMRPQKLAPLGIDADALLARFPRLVYAGLHGFGQDGPYAGRPAYDDVIQGMSGLSALMQAQGGEPRYLPTIAADKTCALVAAQAILAALFQRERTGRGGFVEIPMFETMVAFNLVEHFYGRHFEPALAPAGYPRVLTPWRRPWRTADGAICMMPYTDAHWQRFFLEVQAPALASDPRFVDITMRTRHIGDLLETAGGFVAQGTTAHWLAICERLEIPAAPVSALEDLPTDAHLTATGFFAEIKDAHMGQLRFPGVPVRFDGQRPPVHLPPRLGEHTRQCLETVGLPTAAIDDLIAHGAAFAAPQRPSAANAPSNDSQIA
ncbi:CaiB/BaiF CoA transferase family protein [Variovorax sp. N23]|uniref:CaiB/BaiF CoA transferase family protein n=1 Tax=Variovorax sp. N23 TaxID=2980555 RepID=UPI0021C8680E|nr:CoA transferase [Variovorax sp. N23]MCU4121135.1 CoA transferase [Variovorax sp. N23]